MACNVGHLNGSKTAAASTTPGNNNNKNSSKLLQQLNPTPGARQQQRSPPPPSKSMSSPVSSSLSPPVAAASVTCSTSAPTIQTSPAVTLTPAGRKRPRPEAEVPSCGADREVEDIMGDHAPAASKTEPLTFGKGKVAPAPFSHEEDAHEARRAVDYSSRISLEDARAGTVSRPVRVYADGIYDMFHTGHARQLMQAKMAFPNSYLIVGICSDHMTLKNKGRTVMNETERYEAVRHCRYVDEVVTDAPWTLDLAFLEQHKIDFVAHDELPYNLGSPDEDVYKFVKDRGMFLPTQRTEGISTTDVITRIIKDYDLYIRRNLARGYSHKELNVSYMKAKHLKFKDNYEKLENKLKDKGKDWMGKWKDQLGKGNEMLHKWEEKSKEFIGSFVEMFGRDGRLHRQGMFQNLIENFAWQGRLGQWFQENTQRIGRAISPSMSPLPLSPPSPSTSDPSDPQCSPPPFKRGRYTPPLLRCHGGDSSDSDEDVGDQEEF